MGLFWKKKKEFSYFREEKEKVAFISTRSGINASECLLDRHRRTIIKLIFIKRLINMSASMYV